MPSRWGQRSCLQVLFFLGSQHRNGGWVKQPHSNQVELDWCNSWCSMELCTISAYCIQVNTRDCTKGICERWPLVENSVLLGDRTCWLPACCILKSMPFPHGCMDSHRGQTFLNVILTNEEPGAWWCLPARILCVSLGRYGVTVIHSPCSY